MDANNSPPNVPPLERWLETFLNTEYYNPCKTHEQRNTTSCRCNFFCVDCLGPICEYCRKSQQHGGHYLLQVRLASGACSVASADVERLIDTAGIHKFKINGYTIHFLRGRGLDDGSKRKPPCRDDSLCAACPWRLPGGIAQGSTFCSIRCKLPAHLDRNQMQLLPKSSSKTPLAAVSIGYGLKGRRIVVKSRGDPLHRLDRKAVTTQKAPGDQAGVCVGSHGTKRARDEVRSNKETSPAEPALKNKRASYEEEEKTTFMAEEEEEKKNEREHEDSKANGVIVNSRDSFRVRQRKGTPHRSAEFVILQERHFWFFPW